MSTRDQAEQARKRAAVLDRLADAEDRLLAAKEAVYGDGADPTDDDRTELLAAKKALREVRREARGVSKVTIGPGDAVAMPATVEG